MNRIGLISVLIFGTALPTLSQTPIRKQFLPGQKQQLDHGNRGRAQGVHQARGRGRPCLVHRRVR